MSFTPRPLHPQYPLDRRLDGPQSRCGRGGEEISAFHLGHEADHSPPSSAEVKERAELYLYSPNAPSWRGAQLVGAQGTPSRLFVQE
jgi:hypothetical protein